MRFESSGQQTELVAIGIGHGDPVALALALVDTTRAQGDQMVYLRSLICVQGGRYVEMKPVLPGFRRHRRAAPCDLRTAARRANRGLLVLIPNQRPPKRFAPKVPDLLRTVTRERSDESAVGEELVVRLNDTELVAFRVCKHNVSILRALTNINMPGAEVERPRDGCLLVLERCTRQIEMHPVPASLFLLSWKKSNPEPRIIPRQKRNVVSGLAGHLPVQHTDPEARETNRVVCIEAECDEITSHPLSFTELFTHIFYSLFLDELG
jgi:hypothetical protein